MTGSAVPTMGGRLLLAHWSNGNIHWSGGPPKKDATMVVEYLKAYFNSSEPAVLEAAQKRCDAQGKTCAVSGTTEVKDLDSGAGFFNLTSENGGSRSASGLGSGSGEKKSAGFATSARGLGSLTASVMAGFLFSL